MTFRIQPRVAAVALGVSLFTCLAAEAQTHERLPIRMKGLSEILTPPDATKTPPAAQPADGWGWAPGGPAGQEGAAGQPCKLKLRPCKSADDSVRLVLSTGSGPAGVSVDPVWSLNGGKAFTTDTPHSNWKALTPARWIQRSDKGGAPSEQPGTYVYETSFWITENPCFYDLARLTLDYSADNGAKVELNGAAISSCPGPTCFKTSVNVVVDDAKKFKQGCNTLRITVQNDSGPTGLLVNGQFEVECSKCTSPCP